MRAWIGKGRDRLTALAPLAAKRRGLVLIILVFVAIVAWHLGTGGAAAAVTMAAYVVAFVLGTGASWAQRRAALRALAPLLAAPVVLLTYLVLVDVFRHDPGGWASYYAPVPLVHDRLDAVLNTNLADPGIRSLLADMFVLNYQWLYTAVIVAAFGAALIRVERRDGQPTGRPRQGVFLVLTLVGLVYVVTRFRSSNAARYVLLASPVLIPSFTRRC